MLKTGKVLQNSTNFSGNFGDDKRENFPPISPLFLGWITVRGKFE